MTSKILVNQVRCLNCGSEPYSAHRHDFRPCECGNVKVDGGMEYLRRVFNDDDFMELSIYLDELPFEMCMSALEWADENKKNNLGRLCAIARALRDCGYEIREIE